MQPLVKSAVPLVTFAMETAKIKGDTRTVDACKDWLVRVAIKKPKRKQTTLPLETPVLVFPCNGPIQEWNLTQSMIDEWGEAYPGVNVLAECRKALAWCRVNGTRRKTASGMPRMLLSWFSRVQNERPINASGKQSVGRDCGAARTLQNRAESRQNGNHAAVAAFLHAGGLRESGAGVDHAQENGRLYR